MDRYVRDYWYDHDGCDKIIDMFKVAHEKGHTVPVVEVQEMPVMLRRIGRRVQRYSFEDVWNGVLGEDVWGLHDYMDWITECYTDYWNHFGTQVT